VLTDNSFPWDQAPRYVLRDRDAIYGQDFAGNVPLTCSQNWTAEAGR